MPRALVKSPAKICHQLSDLSMPRNQTQMIFRSLFTGTALVLSLAAPVDARAIEQACMRSERVGNNTRVCACIQGIADQLLTPRDQRLAARFFRDPHLAQETRTSSRSDDKRFWAVYTQFGALAEQSCR